MYQVYRPIFDRSRVDTFQGMIQERFQPIKKGTQERREQERREQVFQGVQAQKRLPGAGRRTVLFRRERIFQEY
jgi:hypothetical protein